MATDDSSLSGAEPAVPGDRVLDTYDRALLIAHGKVLSLVAAYLHRAGVVSAPEFGRSLGLFAAAAAESCETQGDILRVWAECVLDSTRPEPP